MPSANTQAWPLLCQFRRTGHRLGSMEVPTVLPRGQMPATGWSSGSLHQHNRRVIGGHDSWGIGCTCFAC